MAQFMCPLKLNSQWCEACDFSKLESGKPLCDYPYAKSMSAEEIRELSGANNPALDISLRDYLDCI